MNRFHLLFLCALTSALTACQSDRADSDSKTKRVTTRPASMSTASLGEVRLSVPQLGDAGVATDLRQALLALPEVTQVLPDLSKNEVVIRTTGDVSPMRFTQVLQSLGLRGMVR